MARAYRRHLLRSALCGTTEERWRYALVRSANADVVDRIFWGFAIFDDVAVAERTVRWFLRLQKLAGARAAS